MKSIIKKLQEERFTLNLNDCFVKVDKENHKLIFDYKKRKNTKKFKNETFNIDKSKHKFVIKPDHYYFDEDTIYVFDSKYYKNIADLNYKQLAYTILLGNSELGNNKNLYSALLLPGTGEDGLHLELDSHFCQMNQGCNYIIEQFLNVKLLMKNYLNLNREDVMKKVDEKNYSYRKLKVAEKNEEYKYE